MLNGKIKDFKNWLNGIADKLNENVITFKIKKTHIRYIMNYAIKALF